MKPHVQRVIDEQKELQIKLDKLSEFINNGSPLGMTSDNWHLLKLQQRWMDKYNKVLISRIELFGG